MMKYVTSVLLLLSLNIYADYSSYVKSQNYWQSDSLGNIHSLLIRNKWGQSFQENWYFEIAHSLAYSYSSNTDYNVENTFNYRVDDVSPRPWKDSNSSLHQNLDRFYVNFSEGKWDLRLGRQVVSYGSAKFLNASDPFVPFSLTAIDVEDRLGIDAFRIRYALNQLDELDFVYALGQDAANEKSSLYINYKSSTEIGDLVLSIAKLKSDMNLYSIDLQTSFLKQGVWLEVSQVSLDSNSDVFAALGMDYKINNEQYFIIELQYNSYGKTDSNLYDSSANYTLSDYMPISQKAQNYLGLSYLNQIDGINSLSLSSNINLNDDSYYIFSKYERSLSDNSYLDLGCIVGVGDEVSEYNEYGKSLFLSLRYYY